MGIWERIKRRWWVIERVHVEKPDGNWERWHSIPWPRFAWMWFEADWQRKPFGWSKAILAIAGTLAAIAKYFHLVS